tara:strand:- start:868 stop:1017 length:150 start_codon:yes stop_codon:yes gene_type:complete
LSNKVLYSCQKRVYIYGAKALEPAKTNINPINRRIIITGASQNFFLSKI